MTGKYAIKYVVTGGPSSGKTSLIKELAKLGYGTVPEAAEPIILDEKEKAKLDPTYDPILPETHLGQFQELVLEVQLLNEKKGELEYNIMFLDRSLVDGIAYAEHGSLDGNINLSDWFLDLVERQNYGIVFLLDQLPIFEDSDYRHEDLEEAKRIHNKLEEVYRRMKYEVVNVPDLGLEGRAKYIVDYIQNKD
ncbi:AAA family ATPase [Nanoarchaeota archaeon]